MSKILESLERHGLLGCLDGKMDNNGWIRVQDRLPANGQMIAAAIDSRQSGCVCRYTDLEEERLPCLVYGPLKILGFRWKDVTHWQPLPEAPKEDDFKLPKSCNTKNLEECDSCQ